MEKNPKWFTISNISKSYLGVGEAAEVVFSIILYCTLEFALCAFASTLVFFVYKSDFQPDLPSARLPRAIALGFYKLGFQPN